MVWTKEPPTKSGWYWLRVARGDDSDIWSQEVVAVDGDRVYRTNYGFTLHIDGLTNRNDIEWAGPLAPPAAPSEGEGR